MGIAELLAEIDRDPTGGLELRVVVKEALNTTTADRDRI